MLYDFVLGLALVLKEHILRNPSSSKFLTLQGTAYQKLRSLQGLVKADLAANLLAYEIQQIQDQICLPVLPTILQMASSRVPAEMSSQ